MINLRLDSELNVGYLHLLKRKVHHTSRLDSNTLVDYDDRGEVIGIELLNLKRDPSASFTPAEADQRLEEQECWDRLDMALVDLENMLGEAPPVKDAQGKWKSVRDYYDDLVRTLKFRGEGPIS